ncbi:MAG TPA: hypothetical protein VD886_21735 [Herpetosiphonaceae bacterium]|nr:hypothetical protein [Herpetosiphonaceae bacterium]
MLSRLRASWLLTPLVFAALALLGTWPMALHLGSSLNSWGDPQLQTWILAWNAHALASDPLAVWQAPIFAPYPDTLAYTDHHLVLALLSSPIIWLTGNPVLAYNLMVLLSFVLTGWAVHDLALELTGHRGAAFAAGVMFAFGPFRMAQVFHLQLLQTAWLPWGLLFLRRTLLRPEAGWRPAILAGIFLGLQCVTALYYAFFAIVAAGALTAWWAAGQLWRRWRKGAALPWATAGRLVAVAAVAALIVVPLTLPYLRVYRTLGVVRSAAELENWSAPLQSYLSVNAQSVLAGIPPFASNSGEWVLFPGLAATAFGLLALVWRPTRENWFWGGLAAAALLLSLGTGLRWERGGPGLPLPLYTLLYEHLPGFGALRVPARWGMLVSLALALLAAQGLARLRGSLPPLGRRAGAGALAALLLIDGLAIPLRVTNPAALATVPAVYPWLGAPEQADIRTVLELPAGPIPRGAELERITWRMFNSRFHWKRLPVAFSGVIPFGTTDLLAAIQELPAEPALRYLQLAGVDTLVIHRDELPAEELAALLGGLDASPLLSRRAEIDAASVYSLAPSAELAEFERAPGAVFISSDERVPGVLALALGRRWQAAGRPVVGAARLKYYGPLQPPGPGEVWPLGLLAEAEDPRAYGFSAAERAWAGNGLAFYRSDGRIRANLDLARRDPDRTHPTYPERLDLTVGLISLDAGGQRIAWAEPVSPAWLELDVASLRDQTLRVGASSVPVPAGASTLSLPVALGQPLQIEGADLALLRLQVRAAGGVPPPATGLAVRSASAWDGSTLQVRAESGGPGSLLLDIQGASARDDRPIALFAGPPTGGDSRRPAWDIDALRLTDGSPAPDGRYIAYLKSASQPAAPGLPVATFRIAGGALADPVAVPLPLTAIGGR